MKNDDMLQTILQLKKELQMLERELAVLDEKINTLSEQEQSLLSELGVSDITEAEELYTRTEQKAQEIINNLCEGIQ